MQSNTYVAQISEKIQQLKLRFLLLPVFDTGSSGGEDNSLSILQLNKNGKPTENSELKPIN